MKYSVKWHFSFESADYLTSEYIIRSIHHHYKEQLSSIAFEFVSFVDRRRWKSCFRSTKSEIRMSIFYYSLLWSMLYSFELNIASILPRNCIAECSFQMNFDDQFQRPSNCSKEILSYTCVARITILYNIRQIFVYFRTTGSEQNANEFPLYTIQQVSHIFQRNSSSYVILFACMFADNCDWIYARDIIDRFIRVNYTRMFNQLKPLLYENTNQMSSKCYSQNEMVDCYAGVCSSIVLEMNRHEFINRSCVYSSNANIGIDIRRYRGFPELAENDRNYHFYLCNRNLCNNPQTEYSVQSIIQSYASILNIPEPSNTVSRWMSSTHYFLVLVLLLYLR